MTEVWEPALLGPTKNPGQLRKDPDFSEESTGSEGGYEA